jgi:hypothetical protein
MFTTLLEVVVVGVDSEFVFLFSKVIEVIVGSDILVVVELTSVLMDLI